VRARTRLWNRDPSPVHSERFTSVQMARRDTRWPRERPGMSLDGCVDFPPTQVVTWITYYCVTFLGVRSELMSGRYPRAGTPARVREFLALISMAVLAAAASLPAAAQTPSLRNVQIGFNRLSRVGHWTPVELTVVNPGPEGDYEILVTETGAEPRVIYRHPAHVPRNSTYTLHTYVRLSSSETLVFDLRTGERVVDTSKQSPNAVGRDQFVVLACNTGDGVFGFKQNDRVRIHIANVTESGGYPQWAALPERWAGYDGVDAIVFGGVNSNSLTVTQQQALLQWVVGGGMVILAPTGNAGWLRNSFLAPLSPVEIVGERNLYDPASLTEKLGPGLTPGRPLHVWESRPLRGDILLEADSIPIIVVSSYGAGRVVFLGTDGSDEHFRSWPQLERLYTYLLSLRAPQSAMEDGTLTKVAPELLGGMVGVQVATRGVVALLLVLNASLFLGAYWVARRRGRAEWAWYAAALIAPLFAIAVYLLGARTSGVFTPTVSRIQIAHGSVTEASARVSGYLGLVSPRSEMCDIGLFSDATYFVTPLPALPHANLKEAAAGQSAMDFMDHDIKWLRGVGLRPRWLSPLHAAHMDASAPRVDGDAVVGPTGIDVRVRNLSGKTLRNPFLAFNRNICPLQDLDPDAEANVRLSRATALDSPRSYSPIRSLVKSESDRRREEIVRALFSRSYEDMREADVKLYAWVEDGAGDMPDLRGVSGKPQERTEELYIVSLPWRRAGSQAFVSKGVAMAFPETFPLPFYHSGEWQPVRGSVPLTVTFCVPTGVVNMTPSRISLFFNTGGGPAVVMLRVWNIRKGTWDEVPYRPGEMLVDPPGDYYDAGLGSVRVQATIRAAAEMDRTAAETGEPASRPPIITDFDVEIEGAMP
jgi:hypothetical protein